MQADNLKASTPSIPPLTAFSVTRLQDTAHIINDLLERCAIVPSMTSIPDAFVEQCLDNAAAHGCPLDDSTPGVPSFQPWNTAGAYMAYTAYGHLESLETKKYTALYTSLFLYCDDVYKDDPALVNDFSHNFITRHAQRTSILQAFDTLLQETSDHFDAIQTHLIVSGALNVLISISLEHKLERAAISPYAEDLPDFMRELSGIAYTYAVFSFPRFMRIDVYLQAIPAMRHYINFMNDVLSFYKEELVGEDSNYVSILAKCRDVPKLQVLEDLSSSVFKSHSNVAEILSGCPEALQAWKSFAEGYVNFHVSITRYRLGEVIQARNATWGIPLEEHGQ
ncbi:hypothetical protein ONZ45_g18116 [Pleurotus djamor]|nr:hypothetical protein ONZ45_g18116 [Pleurotus djamor]